MTPDETNTPEGQADSAASESLPASSVGSGALLDLSETRDALAYISASPARAHGGFHPKAVAAARSALAHLYDMEARLNRVRELGEVYVYPSDWRCSKMGGHPPIGAYETVDLSEV